MDSTVITKILEILAAPLALILGALATVWVQLIQINGRKIVAAKLGISNDELAHATQICQVAVSAAQQLYKAGKIADRKAYALDMAKQMRDAADLKTITDDFISHIIEAQVWDNISGPAIVAATLATTTNPAQLELPATEAFIVPPDRFPPQG